MMNGGSPSWRVSQQAIVVVVIVVGALISGAVLLAPRFAMFPILMLPILVPAFVLLVCAAAHRYAFVVSFSL